jgi:copper(I)-binding protein
MLMHPQRAISVGTAVTVVLELADGGRISAPFEVRGADAR